MRLMGYRRHQSCRPVGKHFGASDFEVAGPSSAGSTFLVDGDRMGLHGLELTDGAPISLTFTAITQRHRRHGVSNSG